MDPAGTFKTQYFVMITQAFQAAVEHTRMIWGHIHIRQHGVITGDLGEVGFQDGHGASESHMATSTEQGDAREAEDRGHERRIRHPAQTFDAALKAACGKNRKTGSATSVI